MGECTFCRISGEAVVLEDEYHYSIYDRYPVNDGHLLIISKRHVADLFSLTEGEVNSLWGMITQAKELLDEQYGPDGYNVGVNCGEAAGQTIFHFHVHVIPRYRGDVESPKGGIRNIKLAVRPYD